MFNIKEVANILNINSNKIRFYEKKELINIKRDSNNYRIFTEEDILNLQKIILYREIGLSISDIKNMCEGECDKTHLDIFNKQWSMVNDEIHRLSLVRSSLEDIIDSMGSSEKDILNLIEKNSKLLRMKNTWEDKWDFDDWARSYDKDVANNIGALKIYKNYDDVLQRVFEIIETLESVDGKGLEIGVGTGNLAGKFLKNKYNIIGIDQSKEMLSIAKDKYPSLKVRLGEFLKIPYEDKKFDFIVTTYAFHHLNDQEKILGIKEMIRVLKDNGTIVIGDLMFLNREEKNTLLKSYSEEQKLEIEDEYYSFVEELKERVKSLGRKLVYEQIDELNYIVTIN